MPSKAFFLTYNKLHSLWNTTNRSSRAKFIVKESLNCVLKVPCETRWNSRFDAVRKIHDINQQEKNVDKNKVNNLNKRLKNELKSSGHLQLLDPTDLLIIEKYIKVMEPVACALDTLQGEINCSQGLIVPVLFAMKHRVLDINDDSNLANDFKQTMLKVSYYVTIESLIFN